MEIANPAYIGQRGSSMAGGAGDVEAYIHQKVKKVLATSIVKMWDGCFLQTGLTKITESESVFLSGRGQRT
jgi:hypothetical protein